MEPESDRFAGPSPPAPHRLTELHVQYENQRTGPAAGHRAGASRRRARRVLGAAALGAGWVSFAGIVLALAAEHHPRVQRWAVEAARAEVGGPLAETLEIDDIDVRWMQRSIALRGVRAGDGVEEVSADEIVCRLGFGGAGKPRLDRITVRGAEIVLSDALSAALGAGAPTDEEGPGVLDLVARSPEVVVRDARIGLELGPGRVAPVGRVDLSMTHGSRDGADVSRIVGRLVPSYLEGGDGAAGVIWLSGALSAGHVVELEGVARSLLLAVDPESARGTPLEEALRYDPTARMDLVADARIDLARSVLPEVRGTVAVTGGALTLPWLPRAEERRVEDVELRAEFGFAPNERDATGTRRSGWSVEGTLDANWENIDATAGFRGGDAAPASHAFELWASLPGAPLGPQIGELAAGERGIVEVESMLGPRGSADVSLAVRLPRDRPEGARIGRTLERLVLIEPRGETALAYAGAFDRRRGVRDVGFPLAVRRVDGDVTWSIVPGVEYAGQLGIYGARGFHTRGPVDVYGGLHFRPLWEFGSLEEALATPAPFHLVVDAEDLVVDDEFETAMRGLHGLEELRELLPTYGPRGGSLDFRLELWRTTESVRTSLAIDLGVEDLDLSWRELPVPVRDARGSIRVRTSRGTRAAVVLDLEARTDVSAEPLTVKGRIRGEGLARSLSWIQVGARAVNPRSSALREALARRQPGVLAALDGAGAKGFFDLAVDTAADLPLPEARVLRERRPREEAFAGGNRVWIRVLPEPERETGELRRRVTVQPAKFAVATRDVEGSLRVAVTLPPDAGAVARERALAGIEGESPPVPEEAAVDVQASLQGQWRQAGPSVPLAARLRGAEGGEGIELEALGAGLDIANDGLIGAVIDAVRRAGEDEVGRSDPIDTDGVDLAGRLDFAAGALLPTAPGAEVENLSVDVEARLDRLAVGGTQVLRGVSAHLGYDPVTERWVGTEIEARLGETPVQLTDVAWSPDGAGSTFRTRLSASGLPIDEEHLSFFLDETTRRVVLDDLRARGSFDVDGAELVLKRRTDGSTSVSLDGTIGVESAFVDLGMPIELTRVEAVDLRLVHEGRGLRARGRIRGAFGAIAGRSLEDAELELTYVEPRLVLEAFDGAFEGGRMRALGASTSPAANLFSIDLEPPFPFELRAALRDVDVGGFLRGVFDSDFADRGRMDLDMMLMGDFDQLTGLAGGGTIVVSDSALWSIPVFRALGSTLGVDTSVLFREMRCDYRIEDGALTMERMRVDSDLLSLEGDGRISFEGDVRSNLEVKYSIVDRLGPFTRLLYWVQNSLLRVSVRGTMERPTVILRGLVSRLFSPSVDRDRLPLPGLSRRPARF